MALSGALFQDAVACRRGHHGAKFALNVIRLKPTRMIRAGDYLNIRRGAYEWTVIVKGTSTY